MMQSSQLLIILEFRILCVLARHRGLMSKEMILSRLEYISTVRGGGYKINCVKREGSVLKYLERCLFSLLVFAFLLILNAIALREITSLEKMLLGDG